MSAVALALLGVLALLFVGEPQGHPGSETSPSTSWPTVGNDLGGARYSPTRQITPANVARLTLTFTASLDPPGTTDGNGWEDNPIEAKGVIYAASSSSDPTVGAYEALTGAVLWQRTATQLGIDTDGKNPGTRGLALAGGFVYVEEPGGVLVALNAQSGELAWQTLINTEGVDTFSQGTPVVCDGRIFIGISGGDLVGGMRGFVKAIDAKTGKLLWTFHTIPTLGSEAAKTWGTAVTRAHELSDGGGASWTNGVVDPELGLVYFPVGNPWPDFGRRRGDDLYTDSVVALNMKSGKLQWYFQATRHDEWDYDCSEPPVLWNQEIAGKMVHGLSLACKNGYVYELNRETGRPVTPIRYEPMANATSYPEAKRVDERLGWKLTDGGPLSEPIPVGGAVTPHCASAALVPSTIEGRPVELTCAYNYYGYSRFTAGTDENALDWQPASYDPKLGYTYYCANQGIRVVRLENPHARQVGNELVWPQLQDEGDAASEPRTGWLTALNLRDNAVAWQVKDPVGVECRGGSATTATGLVFTSDSLGNFDAYDAADGEKLWSYPGAGVTIAAPPIVYSSGGVEYVAVIVTALGNAELRAFSLEGDRGG